MFYARSICNKFDELSVLFYHHLPDICIITESWFDDMVGSNSNELFDYCVARCDRKRGYGGGIVCYIRSKYSFVVINTDVVLSPLSRMSEFLCLFVN